MIFFKAARATFRGTEFFSLSDFPRGFDTKRSRCLRSGERSPARDAVEGEETRGRRGERTTDFTLDRKGARIVAGNSFLGISTCRGDSTEGFVYPFGSRSVGLSVCRSVNITWLKLLLYYHEHVLI